LSRHLQSFASVLLDTGDRLMKSSVYPLLAAFVLCSLPGIPLVGKDLPDAKLRSLSKTTGTPGRARININRWSSGFFNDGMCDVDVAIPNNAGGYYPKGSGFSAIYESGVLWGAHYGVGGEVRIGGVMFYSGLVPGKILGPNEREDPALPKNRIYRVRPDIPPGNSSADISSELRDGDGTATQIFDQYHADWLEWPWYDGAPFLDRNGDGSYDPSIDVPGVPGADQTLWYVANDMSEIPPGAYSHYYQSMRIEMQQTVWAYAREGALGDMIFRRSVLINKGTTVLDSMYVTLFVDADLGDPGDDLAGSDTTRSLAFVYNSKENDLFYRPLPPPAVGFDFFQGPVVPGSSGDSAIVLGKGKRIYGKRNLPMTSCYIFNNYGGILRDPDWGVAGIPQWYNYMRGLIGRTGEPYIDPWGVATAYPFAGDPERRTGWLDQIPTDIRFGPCSGPFTMAPGDTQEIVVAEIGAGAVPGIDRLSAVGLLKFYDDQGQAAYNSFFNIPTAPPPPAISISALDREVVLTWGNDPVSVAATEGASGLGYTFQGYNVYQLPSASAAISEAKRILTYDIIDGVSKISDKYFDPKTGTVESKVRQFGSDSGIRRAIRISTDAFNSDLPLVNGNKYYFAVTAYNYNPDPAAVPTTLENPLLILTGIPHSPNPGSRLASSTGDTIAPVTQITLPGNSPSDGAIVPIVIDPLKCNGHTYRVDFDNTGGTTRWNLADVDLNKTLVSGQTNQSGEGDYRYFDGVQVIVTGPTSPGMKNWQIPGGARRFTWSGADGYGLEGFNGAMGWAAYFWGGNVGPTGLRNVLLKLAPATAAGEFSTSNENVSYAYRFMRGAQNAPAKPEFAPYIKNPENYGFQDYLPSVPFSAWNIETTPPTRLAIMTLENNVANGLVDGKWWPPLAGVDNWSTSSPREWFFILDAPYTGSTPDPAFQTNLNTGSGDMPLMWISMANRREAADWVVGDEFLIVATHINSPANTFFFTAPKNITGDRVLAREDVSSINVFPNPYYGVNPQETDRYVRFVTFNHLPEQATIRIFNLAGVMVRKIDRTSTSQFEQWDLKNQEGLPVGSGLYIVHIEMPTLGMTKVLKLAIVQEQQILQRY
jgi:hypothetical protein